MTRRGWILWAMSVVTCPAFVVTMLLKTDPGMPWTALLGIGDLSCLGSVIGLFVIEWKAAHAK